MKENYTEAEIEAFYTSFKDPANLERFEQENSSVVETLFAFTDFEKFKVAMKNYQGGMMDQKGEDSTTSSDTANSDVAIVELDKEQFHTLLNEDLSPGNPHGWKKALDMAEVDGVKCTIYQRP